MKLILILASVLLPVCLLAQQEVNFSATIAGQTISLYETVDIRFKIEGTEYQDFQIPDFPGFEIVSGPYQSSQFQFINGKSSRMASYSYTLRAIEVGTFKIKPATITVNGETLETQTLEVEVIKDGKIAPPKLKQEQMESPFIKPSRKNKKNKIIYTI